MKTAKYSTICDEIHLPSWSSSDNFPRNLLPKYFERFIKEQSHINNKYITNKFNSYYIIETFRCENRVNHIFQSKILFIKIKKVV